jgi:hypothetical protein
MDFSSRERTVPALGSVSVNTQRGFSAQPNEFLTTDGTDSTLIPRIGKGRSSGQSFLIRAIGVIGGLFQLVAALRQRIQPLRETPDPAVPKNF